MEVKHIKYLAVLFSAMTVLLAACCKDSFDYGVFTGDDINQQKKYECYDSIVVDPSNFTSNQVETLKADGKNVYYRYHTPEVYQSLKSMLASLKRQGFKLIVNGGDVFVSETLKDGSAKNLYDGINQEDVFTTYDFNKKKYGRQAKKNTDYYERYLKQAKKAGLDVYIVEYRAGRELSKKIDAYCERHGYKWYNADRIKLN